MAAGPIPSAADLVTHGARIAAAQQALQQAMAAVKTQVAGSKAAAAAQGAPA